MPRALPWEINEPAFSSTKKQRSSPLPKKPPRHDSDSEDLVDSSLDLLRPSTPPEQRKRKKRPKHQLDSSPPFLPTPAPPDVEFMLEGYNADDIYRMVEDEFYTTAQSFTRHIHRAEYDRLKKLARSRGAGMLTARARATDGRTAQSDELRLQMEADGLERKRKAEETDSGEEDDDYMQDAQLAGLMTGDVRSGKDLLKVGGVQPRTRAGAGFAQSPRNRERYEDVLGMNRTTVNRKLKAGIPRQKSLSEAEDESDLDEKKPMRRTVATAEYEGAVSKAIGSQMSNGRGQSTSSSIFKQFTKKPSDDSDGITSSGGVKKEVMIRQYPFQPTATSHTTSTTLDETISTRETSREWMAKRRAEKEKKEREQKRSAADDIPTFLF